MREQIELGKRNQEGDDGDAKEERTRLRGGHPELRKPEEKGIASAQKRMDVPPRFLVGPVKLEAFLKSADLAQIAMDDGEKGEEEIKGKQTQESRRNRDENLLPRQDPDVKENREPDEGKKEGDHRRKEGIDVRLPPLFHGLILAKSHPF